MRNHDHGKCKLTFPCGCHSILVSVGRFGSLVPQLLANIFLRIFRRFFLFFRIYVKMVTELDFTIFTLGRI